MAVRCWVMNFKQVVPQSVTELYNLVPVENREDNSRLWKRRGLSSVTLSVSPLLAKHKERGVPNPYVADL